MTTAHPSPADEIALVFPNLDAVREPVETVLAGFGVPYALESRAHALEMALALKEITAKLGLGFVYKTSFDKANRTSARSNRGIGLDALID